ncbi:MAG TPA: transketolase [candidate division Zixibacteria bacterium]|jgi:transketolase
MTDRALEQQCINTIRFLAVDAVERAQSGHPGAPLGMAPTAFVLWDRFLKHDPCDPAWCDRDRFVLSAGHASMLLYSLLHLTGYDLPLSELEHFRQWESKTPGHPECGLTPGVEVTTGPLGQGFANGVGMAMAQHYLAQQFNRRDHSIVDHFIYALVSDGDLQEGISSEAAGLAGTWGLGRLIYLYDSNGIQIDGSTEKSFREDAAARFRAYGWQVIGPVDGNDVEGIAAAIRRAQADTNHPSLIVINSVIGYGSPKQGTAAVHGAPLGTDNARAAKDALGWPQAPLFHIPGEVLAHMRRAVERGRESHARWRERFDAYTRAHAELATRFQSTVEGRLPDGWDDGLDTLFEGIGKAMATRSASGTVMNHLAERLPQLIGGSADLAESNKTLLKDYGDFIWDAQRGRNIYFGVREHAMGAIVNGMARHGGVIPYSATFLTFSDYMRPAMRLGALMGVRAIYIFSHDSIGLGEDGPTHQPIEHLMSLRLIPNLTVIRPADARETAEAWRAAITNESGPTVLVLTRQNVPVLDRRQCAPASELHRGAYTLWQSSGRTPEIIIIGTGSEVALALQAGMALAGDATCVRVVSMPSWELFEKQSSRYQDEVFPSSVRLRIAVEAGITMGWERYVGSEGIVIGMTRFGASAPAEVLYEKFNITVARIVQAGTELLMRRGAVVA